MNFKNPSRAAVSMTAGMLLLAAATFCVQQLASAQTNDQTTAKLVCQMIARKHISHATIDDDVSKRLLARYLKTLDSQKLYFTQTDIDELSKSATVLDDQLKAGNVDFAYSTFTLYLNRINDRLTKVGKLIDVEHDFTIDESITIDADTFGWAKSSKDLDDRWRTRVKYDLLALILDDTSLADARKRLHKRYYNLKNQMKQTEKFEQLEIFLTSLAHCFDPHSSYMSKQTLEDFRIQMELKLQGIGAALRADDGYTVVAQIVPGGAAEKDGQLKVGDKIIGVAQQDDEDFVDIVEMKLTKVVRLIRGPKGTKVRLQIKSKDSTELNVYELTRQVIELKSAEVKGEIIETKSRIKRDNSRIGVINIPSFYRDFRGAQQGRDDFKSTARGVRKVLG
ncbi:MAG: PDZ domain-containing protein, partial [Planctomycetaceae bacterium]